MTEFKSVTPEKHNSMGTVPTQGSLNHTRTMSEYQNTSQGPFAGPNLSTTKMY